ncbi:uncharacterized protein LOC134193591 isoform X2 [Corticium candelabrum]|uniref:uncharacterized protein LOC134193591 isoform X2 n=1 Tax=Corticium candelabrum TaxID=121492 RepID=UPI002E26100A|nr:uncharacterized protein LOC134193591 isoform X2 [Corticium candelabrum]
MDRHETKRTLEEYLVNVKEAVPPAPYRLFMKVLRAAVGTYLINRDVTTGTFDQREFNFTAVDHATSKVRELVDFLGFKAVTLENGLCQEMIIADHEVSRPCLVVFDELSTEELACTTCPNVDDLLHISSVPLLVAHLACNYHLRFEHFLLTTRDDLMPVLQEDILAAGQCVEHLTAKMGVMLEGSECRLSWNRLEQAAQERFAGHSLNDQLENMFVEHAKQLLQEIRLKVPTVIAEILSKLFDLHRTASIVGHDKLLVGEDLSNYLDCSDFIGFVCPTDRFSSSIAVSKALLMKSLDSSLTAVEMRNVAQAVIWQTRNFIYHFEPDMIVSADSLPLTTLESNTLTTSSTTDTTNESSEEESASENIYSASVYPPETQPSVREAMVALRESVGAYPWRLFLKFVRKSVVEHMKNSDSAKASINPRDWNISAVYFDSHLGRQLMERIGYRELDWESQTVTTHDLIMSNVGQHGDQLATFKQLADEELASTECPGVEQFNEIGSIPLWVAHLAYNFLVRVGLTILTVDVQLFELVMEDIHCGLECIEYLALKLNIMEPESSCQQVWHITRRAIVAYIDNREKDFMGEVESHLESFSKQLLSKLSTTVPYSLVCIFNHICVVASAAQTCASGEMLDADDVAFFLGSFDDMPSRCMSERYVESVERMRCLLLKSFDERLALGDVLRISEIAVWQLRNFLYHFRSQNVFDSQTNPLCEERLLITGGGVVDADVSREDHDEKQDVSEKTEDEKTDEDDSKPAESKSLELSKQVRLSSSSSNARESAATYDELQSNDQEDNGELDDCNSVLSITTDSLQEIRSCLACCRSRKEIAKLEADVCCLISADVRKHRTLENDLQELQSVLLPQSELPGVVCAALKEEIKEKTSLLADATERLTELDHLMTHALRLSCTRSCTVEQLLATVDASRVLDVVLKASRTDTIIFDLLCGVIYLLSANEIRSIACHMGMQADLSVDNIVRLVKRQTGSKR